MKGVKTLGGEIFNNIAISGLSERQILYLLWTAAAALSVVTVFVIIKAGKAYKRRQEIVGEQMAQMERDRALYEKYKNADFETLKNAEPRELIYGLALQVQAQVQNAPNPNELFMSLPSFQRYIYSLDIFLEDTEKSLSSFFRNNGEPLLSSAIDALRETGLLTTEIERLCLMFDKDSEVSFDEEYIKKADESFGDSFNRETALKKIKEYILRENSESDKNC